MTSGLPDTGDEGSELVPSSLSRTLQPSTELSFAQVLLAVQVRRGRWHYQVLAQ